MKGGGQDNMLERRGVQKKQPYTPKQIQKLEKIFQVFPHPNEKQRMRLSQELGLDPLQIKFWFQNRRTQFKKEYEMAKKSSLQAEVEMNLRENIALREAVNCNVCPNCGIQRMLHERHNLMTENERLKEELNHLQSLISGNLVMPSDPFSQTDQPILAFNESLSNMQWLFN